MHDIWNPWHGCVKCSEGCRNCYMFFLDRVRDRNGADIYRTKSGFTYPLQKAKSGGCEVFLLTKRPQRVEKCLPKDWGDIYHLPKSKYRVKWSITTA